MNRRPRFLAVYQGLFGIFLILFCSFAEADVEIDSVQFISEDDIIGTAKTGDREWAIWSLNIENFQFVTHVVDIVADRILFVPNFSSKDICWKVIDLNRLGVFDIYRKKADSASPQNLSKMLHMSVNDVSGLFRKFKTIHPLLLFDDGKYLFGVKEVVTTFGVGPIALPPRISKAFAVWDLHENNKVRYLDYSVPAVISNGSFAIIGPSGLLIALPDKNVRGGSLLSVLSIEKLEEVARIPISGTNLYFQSGMNRNEVTIVYSVAEGFRTGTLKYDESTESLTFEDIGAVPQSFRGTDIFNVKSRNGLNFFPSAGEAEIMIVRSPTSSASSNGETKLSGGPPYCVDALGRRIITWNRTNVFRIWDLAFPALSLKAECKLVHDDTTNVDLVLSLD